jgi:tetratricopeptide (TPR) repeat protein
MGPVRMATLFTFFMKEVRMLKKILACLTVLVLAAGSAMPQEEADDASSRLKQAWALKRTSFKQEPNVKRDILLKTVDCYRALVADFPDDKSACAEACFRMGEIYRSLKMTDEAAQEFSRVLVFEGKGEFPARALKELGHIKRREKNYAEALKLYKRVLDECPEEKDHCADAVTWTGKVLLKMGQSEKARVTLIGFAESFPEFPDEAIRNIDLAAASLLREGDSSGASALLEKWRSHFETLLGRDRRVDKKIEKALGRMKTPEMLKQ